MPNSANLGPNVEWFENTNAKQFNATGGLNYWNSKKGVMMRGRMVNKKPANNVYPKTEFSPNYESGRNSRMGGLNYWNDEMNNGKGGLGVMMRGRTVKGGRRTRASRRSRARSTRRRY
jgi:hypothetical protein